MFNIHVCGSIQFPHILNLDRFTNFMHTILTKVIPDNLTACSRFLRRSNN